MSCSLAVRRRPRATQCGAHRNDQAGAEKIPAAPSAAPTERVRSIGFSPGAPERTKRIGLGAHGGRRREAQPARRLEPEHRERALVARWAAIWVMRRAGFSVPPTAAQAGARLAWRMRDRLQDAGRPGRGSKTWRSAADKCTHQQTRAAELGP